jgi:hypothetical protein
MIGRTEIWRGSWLFGFVIVSGLFRQSDVCLAATLSNACKKPDQHPRQADAQADNGELLLEILHLMVLRLTAFTFRAPGHTAGTRSFAVTIVTSETRTELV